MSSSENLSAIQKPQPLQGFSFAFIIFKLNITLRYC
jgi:hypothetical protein